MEVRAKNRFEGILNSTTNVILQEMEEKNLSMEEGLKRADQMGILEAPHHYCGLTLQRALSASGLSACSYSHGHCEVSLQFVHMSTRMSTRMSAHMFKDVHTQADPSGDIDGWDAAVKCLCLARVMMGFDDRVGIADIHRDSLRDVSVCACMCAR